MKKVNYLTSTGILLLVAGSSVYAKAGTPISFAPVVPTALAVGTTHACALMSNGAVKCWGSNAYWAIAQDPLLVHVVTSPKTIPLPESAVAISAGDQFTCAIGTSQLVYCWGDNREGQMPVFPIGIDPLPTVVQTPTELSGAQDFGEAFSIAAGGHHLCLSHVDLACYGDQEMTLLGGVHATAGSEHTCVDSGCWGDNRYGQLGLGFTSAWEPYSSLPMSFVDIETGSSANTTCGLKSDNTLWCWGRNIMGQVGNGTTSTAAFPQLIMTGATTSATGATNSCAIRSGTVFCWGANQAGQLGIGLANSTIYSLPVASLIKQGATSVAVGASFACAIVGNSVECWGSNVYGQLGNGTLTSSASPVYAIP